MGRRADDRRAGWRPGPAAVPAAPAGHDHADLHGGHLGGGGEPDPTDSSTDLVFGDSSIERGPEAANNQASAGAQVVHNPEAPYKRAAFSQYPRPSLAPQNSSELPDLADIKYMCV